MTSLPLAILPQNILTPTWIKNAFMLPKNAWQFLHTLWTHDFACEIRSDRPCTNGDLISVNLFSTHNKVWEGNVFSYVCLPFCSQRSPHVITYKSVQTYSIGTHQPQPTSHMGTPSPSPYLMNLFKYVYLSTLTLVLAQSP